MVCIEDLSGMAFQSESGGHTFEISGTNDSGTAVSLSGTVEARFLRADNVKVTVAGTISSGKASVTLTSNCYTVAGRFSLTIFVTSNSQKVAVYSAVGNVAVTDGVSSGTVPPLVTDSIQTGSMTASGNVTVGGVLDVTPRRCYSSLSQAGWYRAIVYNAPNSDWTLGDGFIIDIDITRTWGTAIPEVHHISFQGVYGRLAFLNESSTSMVHYIDQIRYSVNGSTAYIDIHYSGSNSNPVCVTFDVKDDPRNQYMFVSSDFSPVGPSPSGETVLARYTFAANTITDISSSFALNTSGISGLIGKIHAIYDASSGLVHLNFSAYTASTTFGTSTPIFTCSNSRYVPKATTYGNGMIRLYDGEWYPYEVSIGTTGNIFQVLTGDATRVYGQITYPV